MSLKRHNTSSPECEDSPKRQRSNLARESSPDGDSYSDHGEDVNLSKRPQINTETGQSGAFPGLGPDEAGDQFYGPANDGIDYLRMVRSEARGIPQLLVAQPQSQLDPSQNIEKDEDDEEGGYWDDDGTYTARPVQHPSTTESKLPAAQLYYYDSLIAQFKVVRATMKCIPPLSAIERLTSSQPISFPTGSKKAKQMWKQCLLHREPSPVQVACMDTGSVFQLVRLVRSEIGHLLGTHDLDAVKRFGSWIWAVLGKCPDHGELMSEEVSELRQLAQKAIEVKTRLDGYGKSVLSELEGEEGEEVDEDGTVENNESSNDLSVDIATAKERLKSQPSAGQEHSVQSLERISSLQVEQIIGGRTLLENDARALKFERMVILDMVLSVIGEVYSQHDLLESRTPWHALTER